MNTWCPFLIFRMLYIYHTTCNNECFYIHPAYLCWHWIAELLVLGKNSSRKTTAELSMFSLHSIASRTPSSSTWLPVTIYIYKMPYISRPLIFTKPLVFPRNQAFFWGGTRGTTPCHFLNPRSWSAGRNIPKYPRSKPQDPSDDGTIFVVVDCFKRFPLLTGRFR